MISPPRKGEPYPFRYPPVPQQWRQLHAGLRTGLAVVPLLVVAFLLALNLTAGVTAAVLGAGVAAATAMFVKNRSDRHNAAIDRGEIRVRADPGLRAAQVGDLGEPNLRMLESQDFTRAAIGRVTRFDGGFLVRRQNPRDVAAVVGDDGGCALFDPRSVPDVWAASEYLAGRGREQGAS